MLTTITLAAQAAQPQGGSMMGPILMMVAIFAIMWLFMIRPQQQKQKKIRQFQNSLETGTKVVTSGGIYGVVKHINDEKNTLDLEIARGVVIQVDRTSVFADINASLATQTK